MKTKKRLIYMVALLCVCTVFAQNQEKVDYSKYPDYQQGLFSKEVYKPAEKTADGKKRAPRALPRRVHNGEKSFFPAAFNQDAGSCGSASRIGYMFTAEINAFRNASAAFPENVYPTHFTWLLTEHGPGKEGMARDNGIPNMIDYGGRTFSKLFGYQENHDPFGWMTGYGKWYRAMFNRISHNSQILTLKDPANAELLKGWLYDHNGDPDFGGRGGVAGIGVASAATLGDIKEGAYKGQKYVKYWGESVDHALTIVGYDDDIWCDLNDNNVKDEGETGVWIIVNSWGAGWANGGFVYCPYSQAKATKSAPDFWWPELYHVRKNYSPKKTIKIRIAYSHRSDLLLQVGVAKNLNAAAPEVSIPLSHFTNCGWQIKNGVKLHDVPMLGRWADSKMHTETMEFGYDLTDLVEGYDDAAPLKYFFTIKTPTTATGEGVVEYCSIVNYNLDADGLETSFDANSTPIQNRGKTTTLTTIVYPEPVNAPANLTWRTANTELAWEKPQPSSLSLTGYNIYLNDKLLQKIDAAQTACTVTETADAAKYAVSAVYNFNGSSVESKKTAALKNIPPAAGTPVSETGSINWRGAGFTLNNIFTKPMDECTIEFWIKPASVRNWNFQIGQSWEAGFLFHLNDNGGITAGYNTWERIDRVSNIPAGKWTHIALSINKKDFIVYQDGKQIGKISGKGMPAIANFVVGISGSGIDGLMDEFRVWKEARSADEINSMKNRLIIYPNQFPGLIAYYQMNKIADGRLADALNKNHAPIMGGSTAQLAPTDYPLNGAVNSFELTKTACFVGEKVEVKSIAQPANTLKTTWSVSGGSLQNQYTLTEGFPVFTFAKSGTYTVSMSAEVAEGVAPAAVSKTIEVTEMPMPEPDFRMNKSTVLTGERVSFTSNVKTSPTTTFEWKMEGGAPASASTVNASTVYTKSGTYTVTLKIKNNEVEKSVSKTINVEMSAPAADFSADKTFLIKGGQVAFADQSQMSPAAWRWHFTGAQQVFSNRQNPTVTYNFAGKYKVSLTASNAVGSSEMLKEKYIAVANEDPGNALYFSGGNDYLTIQPTLIETSETARFSIEWWMAVKENTANTVIMSTPTINLLTANENGGGAITLANNETVTLPDGTFTQNSWEHYALVVSDKRISFYKNGILVRSGGVTTLPTPKALGLSEMLRIGFPTNTLNGVIDELRIWKKALTSNEILTGLNQGIPTPAAKTDLDTYLKFDEAASDAPLNSSGSEKTTKRYNIGPAGDMWGVSQAFTAFNYSPKTFTPAADCTYKIVRILDEKPMNVTANTSWAEYKAEFVADGTVIGPCLGEKSNDKNKFGIAGKFVQTGTEEYRLEKKSVQWVVKGVNNDLYVRTAAGFMFLGSEMAQNSPYVTFDKNETGNVRIRTGGTYMTVVGNEWMPTGGMFNFDFQFEEIKPVSSTISFDDVTADAAQQLRFTSSGQLSGAVKPLNGRVSYSATMKTGEWHLLSFPQDIETVRFLGKAMQGDTLRLGGKLALDTDYQLLQFVDGKFVKPALQEGILLKGAYLVRLINPALTEKSIIFETVSGVTFENAPAAPVHNTACGTGMARNATPGVMNGYYTMNAERTLLTLQNGSPENVAPFEAYIPYIGNVNNAPQSLDPTNAIIDLTDVKSALYRPDIQVWASSDGLIKVKGSDAPFRVFNITGTEIPARKHLDKGCYVVLIEGVSFKVIVL